MYYTNLLERAIAPRGMYESLDLGMIQVFDIERQHGWPLSMGG